MMSSKKSIQVAIKVRPMLGKDKEQYCCWRVKGNAIQLIDSQVEPYYFDHIFDQEVNNEAIFEKMAKPIIHSGILGFNGTIFAYGQTSSGKTYTMMGDELNPGVMVLAAKEIFQEISKTSDRQFLLRVGYIEIYNEKIYDLLNKKNHDLKIHETATGIISVNCEEAIVTCEEDLLNRVHMGNKERTVSETNMNERSSRSHAIFRIIIESRKMDHSDDDTVIQSVLNLVDLAGSERADQTGARGRRLKEGGHINKSLLFLSNVIKQLSENEDDKYISFRDSKLTRILQASLGGNTLTAIICTIKPTAVEETQSTLSFAMRAKTIKIKPQVNEIVSDATMMKRLEHKIKQLEICLQEERRKMESQIKVGQLEQRIKHEEVKIISANSLHKKTEKRRYTWCPTLSALDCSMQSSSHSALPVPVGKTLLTKSVRAPSRTMSSPHITARDCVEDLPPDVTLKIKLERQSLTDVEEEEFQPGELCNFDVLSSNKQENCELDLLRTPTRMRRYVASITPVLKENPHLNIKIIENDLLELQEYSNLENRLDIKHDVNDALKKQLLFMTQRNADLEQERLKYIEMENEFCLMKQNLNEQVKRYDDLQVDVGELTELNTTANSKVTKYEEELQELKKLVEKLEMENRDLEFEFKGHKNKSKLRENELLEVLADKDKQIVKLEKSLNNLSEEKIRNSKEDLKQLTRADNNSSNGSVCIKCEDLERLLDENKKVTAEFQKLTLEYEALQLNFAQLSSAESTARSKLAQLEQIQDVDKVECENLRMEIAVMREKLEKVQQEYIEVKSDNLVRIEACKNLDDVVNTVREELRHLQEKYDKIELDWATQQNTITEIQIQYDAVQLKYDDLQVKYNILEHTSMQSTEQCERLQSENAKLQDEISDLKKRVEEAQQKLLKGLGEANNDCSERIALTQKNDELKKELANVQNQFVDIQTEYDDLSNQLMESIQDGELLRKQNSELEERLKVFTEHHTPINTIEVRNKELEDHSNIKMQSNSVLSEDEICSTKSLDDNLISSGFDSCRSESVKSVRVCLEDNCSNDVDIEDELKFMQLNENLQEIEVQHIDGTTRNFVVKGSKLDRSSSYKLVLKNLQCAAISREIEINGHNQKVCMKGMLKQHGFRIVQLEEHENLNATSVLSTADENIPDESELIKDFKRQISQLTEQNGRLDDENKALLQSTESTIEEFRQQIEKLSEELFEKSQVVEWLEKERSEMTLACEELQDRVRECTNESIAMETSKDETLCENENIASTSKETEYYRVKVEKYEKILPKLQHIVKGIRKQQEECKELITNLKVEYKNKLQEIQSSLCGIRDLARYETNELKLMLCERMETHEAVSRDYMQQYREWELRCEEYARTIIDLREQLEAQCAIYASCKCESLQVELNSKNTKLQELEDIVRKNEEEIELLQKENKKETELKLKEELKYEECCKKLHKLHEQVHNKLNSDSTKENLTSNQEQKENKKDDKFLRLEELYTKLMNENVQLQEAQKLAKLKIEELQESLNRFTKKQDKLNNEKSQLETQLDAVRKQMEVEVQQIQELNENLKKRNTQLQDEQILIKVENKNLQERFDLINENQEKLIKEKCDLEIQLNVITKERNSELKKSDVLSTQFKVERNELLEEQQQLKVKNEELQNSLEEWVKKQELLKNEKLELETKLSEIRMEMNTKIQISGELYTQLMNENTQHLESLTRLAKTEKTLNIEKCDLQMQLITLKKEKDAIETQMNSIDSVMTEKLTGRIVTLKSSHESLIQTMQQEKNNLLSEIETIKKQKSVLENKEEKLVSEMDLLRKKLVDVQLKSKELETQIEESKEYNTQLVEKQEYELKLLQEQLKSYDELQNDRAKVNESIQTLKSQYESSMEALKHEKEELLENIKRQKKEKLDGQEMQENLYLKIGSLSEEVNDLRNKAEDIEKMRTEYENLEKMLSVVKQEKFDLIQKVQALQSEIEKLQRSDPNSADTFKFQQTHIKSLQKRLEVSRTECVMARQQQQLLQSQLDKINDNICENQRTMRYQEKEMEGFASELQLKCDSLENANRKINQSNIALREEIQKLKEKPSYCEQLNVELDKLKKENEDLRIRMELTLGDASKRMKSLQEDPAQQCIKAQQQVEEYKILCIQLNKKEEKYKNEIKNLDGTISCLLAEKKVLEDKLYVAENALKALQKDLRSMRMNTDTSNTSMESNKSISPMRRCVERLSGEGKPLKLLNINFEDKLTMQQKATQERKQRRLSTHDERRQQSFLGLTRDVACLTDPTDKDCNCIELDLKLKECERDLFIRDSQVNVLKWEMKNHPLKADNANLIRRLEEEQEKNRIEMKRYKESIANLEMMKATPKIILANASIQTEKENDDALSTLQTKYNDLKNICRYRYNFIKTLEEKIVQLELAGGTRPMTEDVERQIDSLNRECNLLRQKLISTTQKYEKEVESLRKQLG